MKQVAALFLTLLLVLGLCACRAEPAEHEEAEEETELVISTAVPAASTEAPAQAEEATEEINVALALDLPAEAEGWADAYIAFLEDNYDVFAALWPEGLAGVGFIDLDLDGTPEMVLFDQGASAAMGVQIFDWTGEQVVCVSSAQESASGAFGDAYFSKISVCANYFDDFRLFETEDGYAFWVQSSNSTMESTWNEIIRFGCVDGIVTLASVCGCYLEIDGESGDVVTEKYTVDGAEADTGEYLAALDLYENAVDTGYEAGGIFLWNDLNLYDTTYDGLLAMARDAADAYEPL